MKKRTLSAVLSCAMVLTLALGLAPFADAAGSLANFNKTRTYSAGMFLDVERGTWYEPYVSLAYEYAIIDGDGAGGFNPNGTVTLAETVKLASCLNAGFYGKAPDFSGGGAWYEPYVSYAKQNGILRSDYVNYNAAATRADFAAILGAALPDEALTAINRVDDDAIPDVSVFYSYGPAVYKLYRAGILSGTGSDGAFYPGRSIQRAEAAAVCVRMMDAQSRLETTVTNGMTPDVLYDKSVSAVFYIEIYDKDGNPLKNGSGFFISGDGVAVTNCHVVIGGHSAKIWTHDGEEYDVLGIYSHDWQNDIAILKVEGGGYNYLTLGDSDTVVTGETVYAIGSPAGLQNTISSGIVSYAARYIDGVRFIQTDASLTHGSSGGPLLTTGGLVIGVVSAGAENAQNVSLCVPVNVIKQLARDEWVTLDSLLNSIVYYKNYPTIPDLGAYAGIEPFRTHEGTDGATYSYKVSDFDKDSEQVLNDYRYLLEQSLYTLFGYYNDGTNLFDAYYSSASGLLVIFGTETIGRTECISVYIRPLFGT